MREPEGFREYVMARQGALGRAAYLMSGDRHLAEDLVQTSLARAWSQWEVVSRAGNVDAYVHRILVNAFISATRRRWRRELPSGDRLPEPDHYDPYLGWADREVLLAAVRRLPPRQRAVIALRFYLDQTEAATAEALGCSVGTVKSQSAKALARLRAYMGAGAAPAMAGGGERDDVSD
jgi:RNA polymerase sigma-70 factor (sigma-E family)